MNEDVGMVSVLPVQLMMQRTGACGALGVPALCHVVEELRGEADFVKDGAIAKVSLRKRRIATLVFVLENGDVGLTGQPVVPRVV